MDAPLSPSGLFGDAVNSVVERFQESVKQAAALQKLLPRRMLTSTELPCGIKMNNCSYFLDLLTRGPLHLSKGWASGWSRPSHLLMSRPVNLLLWLSGPTRPGVWLPPRPWYQELLSKRFVMRQGGPHRTHSSDIILWTWTLPQVPRCCYPSAARLISHRTGICRYGDVVLTFSKRFWRNGVPLKGNIQLRL